MQKWDKAVHQKQLHELVADLWKEVEGLTKKSSRSQPTKKKNVEKDPGESDSQTDD